MEIGEQRRTIIIEPIEAPAPAMEPSPQLPAEAPSESRPAEEPALAPDR
jgi:hypothetical protein